LDADKILKKEVKIADAEIPKVSKDPMDLQFFDDEFTTMTSRGNTILQVRDQRKI